MHEDKKNKYDPNAIELLVRGEAFGNAGYIAKEQTEAVRKLAIKKRVDVFEAKGVRMTRKYRLKRTAFIGCRNTAYMDVDDAEPCPFCGSRQLTIYPYGQGTTSYVEVAPPR